MTIPTLLLKRAICRGVAFSDGGDRLFHLHGPVFIITLSRSFSDLTD